MIKRKGKTYFLKRQMVGAGENRKKVLLVAGFFSLAFQARESYEIRGREREI